jgi:hypothetical protein
VWDAGRKQIPYGNDKRIGERKAGHGRTAVGEWE